MYTYWFSILFFLFTVFSGSYNSHSQNLSATTLLKEMFRKSAGIKSMQYVMKKQERVQGKMIVQKSFSKVHYDPLKVYVKQLAPKVGQEALFVEGVNNNQILVNTNGFPWINLSLDPLGSLVRNNQHHTIYDAGYRHIISIFELLVKKYENEFEKYIHHKGTVTVNGNSCWFLLYENPKFANIPYTLKEGESIYTIARKYKLCEQMILELNKKYSKTSEALPGHTIIIPADYAPKLELYIDKNLMMPILLRVYDAKGLFEQYEYSEVILNPAFTPTDFSKENEAYNF